MASRVHQFGSSPTAGSELTITTEKLDRTVHFAGAFLQRSAANPLIITVEFITDWGTFPFIIVTGITASSWGSTLVSDAMFPLAAGMRMRITTSGIGGAETVSGVILLEEYV